MHGSLFCVFMKNQSPSARPNKKGLRKISVNPFGFQLMITVPFKKDQAQGTSFYSLSDLQEAASSRLSNSL